ncbi:cadherin-3 isoform X2 [Puntigrus tetrazona]|uniref:cadherin-3 isoform X2 n=1 Tax=Puntigrus tetrazona TaxID=1606681 RepID=UPI001C89D4DB|nr:cadherin-3 isoform X2 [Puntigrus tetrazona]
MEAVWVVSCCLITFLYQVFSCAFAAELTSTADTRAVLFSAYNKSTKAEHVYSHEDSNRDTSVNAALQVQIPSGLLVVEFPSSSSGQRRKKREWVIPPYSITENERGKFPRRMFQLKAKIEGVADTEIRYSITGEGADKPPVDIFTVDKMSGYLYVTQPLDRETKGIYELNARAISENGKKSASPTNLTILVTDQNDNKPVFTENPFNGQVSEAESKGYEFMTVTATDADQPETDNSIIRYRIVSLHPTSPNPNMFEVNTVSGTIYVNSTGLDKEVWPKYTLLIEAADMEGNGLSTTGTAVITITDSNDNPPQFEQTSHNVSVPENKVGHEVARLTVTDEDEVGSPAWTTKYRIINGDKGGFFTVSTGPNTDDFQEGIITTVKPLDFERTKKYVLFVIVENDEPFVGSLPTSTATVTINVQDVNEPPEFNPKEMVIYREENLPVGSNLIAYTATDPDTGKSQKITYKIDKDPAEWLNVNQDTGMIKVKRIMDRESAQVNDGKYRATILALDDDGTNPETGTGTLVIELEDVNDNVPVINEGSIKICNREAIALLSVTDKDSQYAAPFSVEPQGDTEKNWTARMNETILLLLLLLLIRKKPSSKKPLLLEDDDTRDNIYCYDVEGGGEDDQNFDLSVLHRGLDNRPEVLRNDVAPIFLPAPEYRPRPANPEEIGTFIGYNLKAADNDPTAPPYDSLLVFDYEGAGSDAGSLSSLNSSSSGHDQDYDFLNEWGPRFKKLADMFGGGEV